LTPTYEHFDYDDLFSGKVNLLTDLEAAARLGFSTPPLVKPRMPSLAGFVRNVGCSIGPNRSQKRPTGGMPGGGIRKRSYARSFDNG
jgi:hypothetical protein